MNEKLTEVVFILDESGSMSNLRKDTIGGFNSMLEKQKKEEGECLVSLITFNNHSYVVLDRVPITEVKNLTEDDYIPRGGTALLDAVGSAIHHIGNVHKYAREEDRPRKTLFVITTDGMENCSTRYCADQVKSMVKRQEEKYDWQFIFLGANIDAVDTARRFGIRSQYAVNYVCDSEGTSKNFDALDIAISEVRHIKRGQMLSCCFRENVDKDYNKRHKEGK